MSSSAFVTAQQVCRRGEFDLPCTADKVLPFFSPEGEREWVKGWDPRPVFPERIEFRRDTVFRQGEGVEDALWTVVDVDWKSHRAEYVRVAPMSHAAHIVVKVDPAQHGCHVGVTYVVTAFGDDSTSVCDSFSEVAFAGKMRNWQAGIGACLERWKSGVRDQRQA